MSASLHVALALSLLEATSDEDRHGRPVPAFHVDVDHGLAPLSTPRLGLVRFEKYSRAEPEQQKMFEAAVEKLRASGAAVEELALAELDRVNWGAINTILASEGAAIFADLVARFPDRTSDHLKSLVATGQAIAAPDYLAAKAQQERWRLTLGSEMKGFDALLTLPAFGEAPRGLHYTGDAEYCAPWTFVGAPAVTLPAGFGKNGLPLGIQIVGEYRNDLRVLKVTKWVEGVLGFDPGVPKLAQ
jgi:Asp-tRNA(Asn)/Glu-tRNA(Gln) amidotransferase A subunit family amidase